MIFSAFTDYLQMSPGSGSYFSSYWRSAANTHTHTWRPIQQVSLLHKACSIKSTPPSPLLFHHEDATEKYMFSNYIGNIYLELCVPLFHFSVSWFSEMQFGVIYLKTWGSTQPMWHSWHLFFVLVALFLAEHIRYQILLPWMSQCLLCLESSLLVGSWMRGVFFVLWSEDEAPFPPLVLGPSPVSVWVVSVIILNHKRWEW